MIRIRLRKQKASDAKRFYEILNNPNFKYWPTKPKSVKAEIEWLKKNKEKAKKNIEHNFSILCSGKLVGRAGIKIDQQRSYIGEIGYFVDEAYWGRGIATKAVKILEKIGFKHFGLVRIEIRIDVRNKVSQRVAVKCGYKREGLLKKSFRQAKGEYTDNYLYAKTKPGDTKRN